MRPLIEYGLPVTSDIPTSLLNAYQVIQNKAIRLALKLPRSTNIETLHSLAKIPTLKERLNARITKFLSPTNLINKSFLYEYLDKHTEAHSYQSPLNKFFFPNGPKLAHKILMSHRARLRWHGRKHIAPYME